MKILVTTVFFPPQNLIASQRPYVWARTWACLGHDVTVLTVEKDEDAPDKLSKPFDGFSVIQVSVGAFIRRLRGRRRKNDLNPIQTSVVDSAKAPSLKSRIVSWFKGRGLMSSVRWPDAFDLILPSAWRVLLAKNCGNYEVIVSSFGPHASLAIGYFAKRINPNSKWVLDFRDLWVGNHVYPGLWPFTLIEQLMERFYVKRADLIVTVSDALANELRIRYPRRKVLVSPNGFDPEEVASVPRLPANFRNEHFTIVYTGSLHEDQRNPGPLFEAMAKLPAEIRSRSRVKFAGPIPEFLPRLVAKYGLNDCVQLLGRLPHEQSLRLQAEADVLLFLEKQREEIKDGVLTGKIFEYLVTGRPIWAVGIDDSTAVGRLLRKSSAGNALGTDEKLIRDFILRQVPLGRPASREMTSKLDVAFEYNRVHLATALLHSIIES